MRAPPAISVTVSITFQTVQKATLAEAFDLQGTQAARVPHPRDTPHPPPPLTRHPRADRGLAPRRAGAALSDYIKQLGWTEDASGLVTIPLNEENQPKPEPTVAPVRFERTGRRPASRALWRPWRVANQRAQRVPLRGGAAAQSSPSSSAP